MTAAANGTRATVSETPSRAHTPRTLRQAEHLYPNVKIGRMTPMSLGLEIVGRWPTNGFTEDR